MLDSYTALTLHSRDTPNLPLFHSLYVRITMFGCFTFPSNQKKPIKFTNQYTMGSQMTAPTFIYVYAQHYGKERS